MRTSDLLGDQVLVTQPSPEGWATAGTESVEPVFRAPHDLTVTAVYFIPGGDVSDDPSHYADLILKNLGDDGTGTTVVANRATDAADGSDDQEDGVPWELDLSATEANLQVDAGEVLAIEKDTTGDGVAIAWGGVFVVHYRAGHAT